MVAGTITFVPKHFGMKQFPLLLALLLASQGASAFFVNLEVVHAGCGNATGSITAYVSGGTPPYNFLWGPAPPSGQGTNTASGLAPGTWSVDVTDGTATTVSVSVVVNALPGLDMSSALAASWGYQACPGLCTGQLYPAEQFLGGMPPYVYATAPPTSLNAICGNAPFDLTITDAFGCAGTITTVVPEVQVPSLLYTEVIGPCGGAPTAVVAHFDVLPAGASVSAPGGTVVPSTGMYGGIGIVGATPGLYSISYVLPAPCAMQYYAVFYPGSVTDCANVSGDLYVDVNGDCLKNGSDFGLPNRTVDIAPGFVAMSNPGGYYARQLPYNTYDLSHYDATYTQNCAVASPVNFTVDALTPTATIDLAYTPGPDPDVAVVCGIGQAVPGFQQQCQVVVQNLGAVASGPITVTMDHDPLLTFAYSNGCTVLYWAPLNSPIYPSSILPGQLTWTLPNGLVPLSQTTLMATLYVPPDPLLIGTNFTYTVQATTVLTDADLSNNNCTHVETVVGSFDPNDKQASTTSGSSTSWYLALDSSITYTIRFQNTGTAPAVNVVLVDTIGLALELSTLEVLGASHTFSSSLDSARVLRFSFDHILLPDSNANEPASHGFAQFSIRPVAGLSPGQTITNAADIYFDFNPPIRTNTSELFVEFGVGTVGATATSLAIYPNPANDLLFVRGLPAGPSTVEITGLDGRLVQRSTAVSDRIAIDRLVPGVYLLKLITWDGGQRTARFVKQ